MTKPSVRIGTNELCFLWKGDQFLKYKFLYFKKYGTGYRMLQIVHPEPLLTNLQFLDEFQYRSNLTFLWPNLLFKLAQINCASFERVRNSWGKVPLLEMVWYWLQKVCRMDFRFLFDAKGLHDFSIGQTFSSYDQTFCPNWLKWTVLPAKEWSIF